MKKSVPYALISPQFLLPSVYRWLLSLTPSQVCLQNQSSTDTSNSTCSELNCPRTTPCDQHPVPCTQARTLGRGHSWCPLSLKPHPSPPLSYLTESIRSACNYFSLAPWDAEELTAQLPSHTWPPRWLFSSRILFAFCYVGDPGCGFSVALREVPSPKPSMFKDIVVQHCSPLQNHLWTLPPCPSYAVLEGIKSGVWENPLECLFKTQSPGLQIPM